MASDRTVYGENATGDDACGYTSCKEGERVMRPQAGSTNTKFCLFSCCSGSGRHSVLREYDPVKIVSKYSICLYILEVIGILTLSKKLSIIHPFYTFGLAIMYGRPTYSSIVSFCTVNLH